MEQLTRPSIKYQPCHCVLLQREVWAILTRQADGRWQIVNCLDKEKECFTLGCAFTADGGEWPFLELAATPQPGQA